MADEAVVIIDVQWKNQKAIRAFNVICRTLEDIAEDFPYRDDVQNDIKAANYLSKNIIVAIDDVK